MKVERKDGDKSNKEDAIKEKRLPERTKKNEKEKRKDALTKEAGTTKEDINESEFIKRLCHLERKVEKFINTEDRKKEQMTYANITKEQQQKQGVATLKRLMKAEREEEQWIESTKCNIIVHNLGEDERETEEEQRTGDKKFVEDVVNLRMKFDIDIVKVERIGVRDEEKFKLENWRPLKVTLKK